MPHVYSDSFHLVAEGCGPLVRCAQTLFVCLFPFRIKQKTLASTLESGSELGLVFLWESVSISFR